jgi:glyoxylase-like metal-dependent hydrolase (beta-lactamase superfamily II)
VAHQFNHFVFMPIKLGIIPVTPFEQNCSILVCQETGDAAVVDPGGDIDKILDGVRQLGGTVKKILLTHGHLDHCAAAKDLSDQLGVPIEGPQIDEQFWLDQLPEQTVRFGFGHAKAFVPTRWLEDGDHVQVGNVDLEVFHCPGHTPGHVVFFDKEDRLALVGDVLFAGSIGRTDFPRGNHADLINAIKTKLWPLGDDVQFVPGHGPMSTFGKERQTNPYVRD